MADFNWNDHPVVEPKADFNWNDHPVIESKQKPDDRSFVEKARDLTLGIVGKGLGYPGNVAYPARTGLTSLLTGKPSQFKQEEYLKGLDPRTLAMPPSGSELLERSGVPKGHSLSEYLPFASGNKDEWAPWYQPRKGGPLDITQRGVQGFGIDVATDPLTAFSMGGSGLAKKALAEDATRQAVREAATGIPGIMNKIGDAGHAVQNAATSPFQAMAAAVPKAISSFAMAPSNAIKNAGKWLYNASMEPIEAAGNKFRKSDLGESYYKAGMKTTFGGGAKTEKAVADMAAARDKILKEAGAAGAAVDPELAMAQAQSRVDRLSKLQDAGAKQEARRLQEAINKRKKINYGEPEIPGTPDTTIPRDTGLLDEWGKPVMGTEKVPGIPTIEAVPGTRTTPQIASDTASSQHAQAGASAHAKMGAPSLKDKGMMSMARGEKEASTEAVRQALGDLPAENILTLNKDMSNILSSKKGLETLSNRLRRTAQGMVIPSGATSHMGAAVASLGGDAVKYLIKKAIFDTARIGAMPTGYAVRRGAEMAAPLIDAGTRELLLKYERGLENEKK